MNKMNEMNEVVVSDMSLRDYFASLAMHKYVGNPEYFQWSIGRLCAEAYEIADAMLKQRNSPQ